MYTRLYQMAKNAGLLLVGLLVVVLIAAAYYYTTMMKPAAGVAAPAPAGAPAGGAAPSAPAKPTACDYQFTQGYDSNLGDIKNVGALPVDQLKRACDTTQGCLGFNTNGWIKNSLLPRAQWNQWTSDPAKGFYAKTDPACFVSS